MLHIGIPTNDCISKGGLIYANMYGIIFSKRSRKGISLGGMFIVEGEEGGI